MMSVTLLFAIFAAIFTCENCPSQRIVHVHDWHYVSHQDFAADLKEQSDEITDEEIDQRYAELLEDVEAVQAEQVTILRDLIRQHFIRRVFKEGVTDENVERFRATVKKLASVDLAELERRMIETDDFGERALMLVTIDEYRVNRLELGAVGQLMMTGELEDVIPLDDQAMMAAANPTANGFKFDGGANADREREMVRRFKTGGPVAVVILGGGHDLMDDVQRDCFGCSLTVLTPESHRRAVAR